MMRALAFHQCVMGSIFRRCFISGSLNFAPPLVRFEQRYGDINGIKGNEYYFKGLENEHCFFCHSNL